MSLGTVKATSTVWTRSAPIGRCHTWGRPWGSVPLLLGHRELQDVFGFDEVAPRRPLLPRDSAPTANLTNSGTKRPHPPRVNPTSSGSGERGTPPDGWSPQGRIATATARTHPAPTQMPIIAPRMPSRRPPTIAPAVPKTSIIRRTAAVDTLRVCRGAADDSRAPRRAPGHDRCARTPSNRPRSSKASAAGSATRSRVTASKT